VKEWKEYLLEELADDITVGYVGPMSSEYVSSGIPFLRSLNVEPLKIIPQNLKFISHEFHKKIGKSKLLPGDVVIVRTGKPGACALIPEWLNEANCSDLVIVRCGDQIDNYFLTYYINSKATEHIYTHTVGAVQQHFNVASARSISIPLPPLPEQKAIASVLGSLDDKIDLLTRQNRTLEALAETLFRQWFIEEAKEDWEEGTLEQFCSISRGASPRPIIKYVVDGTVPWIKIADATGSNTFFIDSTKEFIIEAGVLKSVRVSHGDLIMSNSATCGLPYFVEIEGCIHDGWLLFRELKHISRLYLFFFLCSVYRELNSMADGSVQNNLNTEMLKNYPVKKPPVALIQQFNECAEQCVNRIKKNIYKIRTLEKTRDTLLPKLMSGEVRVGS